MNFQIDAPFSRRDDLGEGPHWDERTGTMLWVDLPAGTMVRMNPVSGEVQKTELGPPACFAIPTSTGEMVVGRHHTVELLCSSGASRVLATVDENEPDLRLNDAKCDPLGRLVFGTMSLSRRKGAAALYILDPLAGLTRLAAGVSLSNGLGWDVAAERFYHVDSDAQAIYVYDYDLSVGDVSDRRVFASIAPEDGLPDGMAVDAGGGIWLALFGGGVVRRYAPNGEISAVVELPVLCPTSVAFGGDDLRTLYVTSARNLLDDPRQNSELAGAILVLEPGIAGCGVGVFGTPA